METIELYLVTPGENIPLFDSHKKFVADLLEQGYINIVSLGVPAIGRQAEINPWNSIRVVPA